MSVAQSELVSCELTYSSDAEPGFSRHGTKRMTYRDGRGTPVRDPEVLARIKALAIPPAWTDVWICTDPRGHLQATGRDAKGRKQARYHADFRAERESVKFSHLPEFAEALPRIRRQVEVDLGANATSARRQVALVVHLLDLTAARVGNEQYVRQNGSFGLSTLRTRQVKVDGADVDFSFVGKSGKRHRMHLHDRRVAKLVRACQDLPGQRLFSYIADDGSVRTVCSHDVNDYLREVSATDFTAKTFRTWIATSEVAAFVAPMAAAPSKQALLEGIDHAASVLGNTRSVCRSSYVHPSIERTFLDGDFGALWDRGPRRATTWLTVAERRTQYVLQNSPSGGR